MNPLLGAIDITSIKLTVLSIIALFIGSTLVAVIGGLGAAVSLAYNLLKLVDYIRARKKNKNQIKNENE